MTELDDGRMELPRSRPRFIAFGVVAALMLVVLGARLFQLQVLSSGTYRERVAAASTVDIPVPAPRGLVYDREGRPLVVNTTSWTVQARPADLPRAGRMTILRRVAELTGADASVLRRTIDGYGGSPFDLVPLVPRVSRDAALLIGEEAATLPGIVVSVDPQRRYLDETGAQNGELLSHILGYTGPINADELAALADDGYLPDDVIGRDGVEASFEETLRGTYGSELWERDAAGRATKLLERQSEPIPGTNLMLTIDARLQRLATESLRWGMDVAGVRQGVTIVMNPQTGEILAMVSLPAYDNNTFAAGIEPDVYQAYLADADQPLRNHAIADVYPPGSTYKLVTALAALEEGVTRPGQLWQTYGCYQVPGAAAGDCLYDWNRQGFGQLDVVDAFAISSDTFFYQMAVALGIDPLADWAHELGFGERTRIELPGEASGTIASTAWAQAQGREGVFTGELAQAGIGQNVIAVTPLQLLNAYAALANGGHLMRPMIVRGETDASGNLTRAYAPTVLHEVAADPANLETLRIGAREVITTGHAYNIKDLPLDGTLAGKTGTAEFGELTAEGTLPFHSWFVAYLPSSPTATDAQLAVVTFSYSATVPGNVSTEVTKDFLQRYFDLGVDLRLDPNDFSLVDAN
jgi:penicillin-binding protein 2